MEQLFRTLVLATALVLALTPPAAEAQPPELGARQPGPPMWKVRSGDNVLWIFPHLALIPKDMAWNGEQVFRVISTSQEYIGMPRQEADTSLAMFLNPLNLVRGYRLLRRIQHNPDGSSLEESLTPDMYARFAALKSEHFPHNDDIDDLRPLFAGGRMAVLIRDEQGLIEEGGILEAIWKQARANDAMKTTDIAVSMELAGGFGELADRADSMLTKLSREEEQACFEQRLRHFEQDLEHLKSRASSWARGDIDAFRAVPLAADAGNACVDMILQGSGQESLRDAAARLEQMWLDAAQAALSTNTSTFAVLDIDDLLRDDGPLQKLSSMGYVIEAPR